MSQPEIEELDMEVADETELESATPADDQPVESEGTDAHLTEGGDETAVDVPQVSHEEYTALKAEREQLNQRLQQSERLMPFATEYMQKAAQFRQWEAEQAKAAEQAKQVERKKWEAPAAYAKGLERKLARDAAGNIVIRPEFAGEVTYADVQAFEKRTSFEAENLRRFNEEGPAFLREIAGDDFRDLAREEYQRAFQEHEQRAALEDFQEGDGQYLFSTDATGQVALNEYGVIFDQFYKHAQALNVGNTKKQLKYAWGELTKWIEVNRPELLKTPDPTAPAAPAKTAAQLRDETNGQFLAKTAGRAPGRGGAQPAPGKKNAPRIITDANWDQVAREELAAFTDADFQKTE